MPDLPTILALLAVGMTAGIVSYVVSLASLVSYPALLALGLPPVAANVTNTVCLAFTGVGATVGARRELAGQGGQLRRLAVIAIAGGATGSALLLALPGRSFELVVPPLIAFAAVTVLFQPRFRERAHAHAGGLTPATTLAFFGASVYIGYFGAAGGILSLVALTFIIDRPLGDVNAARAVLSAASNGAALIGFALFGPVHWGFVPPLAAGLFLGGFAGPWFARRLREDVFRLLVAGAGISVAILLAIQTYGG